MREMKENEVSDVIGTKEATQEQIEEITCRFLAISKEVRETYCNVGVTVTVSDEDLSRTLIAGSRKLCIHGILNMIKTVMKECPGGCTERVTC